jgi:hypothetical protein
MRQLRRKVAKRHSAPNQRFTLGLGIIHGRLIYAANPPNHVTNALQRRVMHVIPT